jgi:putative solute:sodium symporter small subunit
MNQNISAQKYWKINLKYLSILLFIWFISSFGLGIFFVDALNNFNIGGFPLGFWFAQQGSIYIFVVLIFTYVFLMNRLDKRFGFED